MAPPKGKGKDFSRMSAPPGPSPPSAAAPPSASASAAPSEPGPGGVAATATRVPSPSPRSGKPKGKDFSRMTGPPASQSPLTTVAGAQQQQQQQQQPPPLVVPSQSQPPSALASATNAAETFRRQNAARLAAGMAPIDKANQPPTGNRRPSSHQLKPPAPYAPPQAQAHHQPPLASNAPPNFRQPQPAATAPPTQAPKQAQQKQQQRQSMTASSQAQQQPQRRQSQPANDALANPLQKGAPPPTQQPSWSEARLSTLPAPPLSTAKKGPDGRGKSNLAPVLGEKIQALCRSIDPSYALDSEVQERLVEMADSFVDKVTRDAIKLAKHRGSDCLDVADVALALKKGYNMEVPGLGPLSLAKGGNGGGQGMGGWLLTNKVKPEEAEPPSKKRRASGAAAAAAAAAMM